jgi:hypothetical protein
MKNYRRFIGLLLTPLIVFIGLSAQANTQREISFDQVGEVSSTAIDPEIFSESAWVGEDLYFVAKGDKGLGIHKLSSDNSISSIELPVDETVIDIPMLASHGGYLLAALQTNIVDSTVDVYSFDGEWLKGRYSVQTRTAVNGELPDIDVQFGYAQTLYNQSIDPQKYKETAEGVFFYVSYVSTGKESGNVVRFRNGVFEELLDYNSISSDNPITAIGYEIKADSPGNFWYAQLELDQAGCVDVCYELHRISASADIDNPGDEYSSFDFDIPATRFFLDFHFADEKIYPRIIDIDARLIENADERYLGFSQTGGRLAVANIADISASNDYSTFEFPSLEFSPSDRPTPIDVREGSTSETFYIIARDEIISDGEQLIVSGVLVDVGQFTLADYSDQPGLSRDPAAIMVIDSEVEESPRLIAMSLEEFAEPGYAYFDVIGWKNLVLAGEGTERSLGFLGNYSEGSNDTEWRAYKYRLSDSKDIYTGLSFASHKEHNLVEGPRLIAAKSELSFNSTEVFELGDSPVSLASFVPSNQGKASIIEAKLIDGKPIVISKFGQNYSLVDPQEKTVNEIPLIDEAETEEFVDVEKLGDGYLISRTGTSPGFEFFDGTYETLIPNKTIAPIDDAQFAPFDGNLVAINRINLPKTKKGPSTSNPSLFAFDSTKTYQTLHDLYPGFGFDSLTDVRDLYSDDGNLYFSEDTKTGDVYYRFNGTSLESINAVDVELSLSIGDKHYVYATEFNQSAKVFEVDFDTQTLTEIDFPASDSLNPNVSKLFDRNGGLCVVANPDSSNQPGNNLYCLVDAELLPLDDTFNPTWAGVSEVISVGDELYFHATTNRDVVDPISEKEFAEREMWVYSNGEFFEMTQKGTTIGPQLFDFEGPVTSAFSQARGWELFRVSYDLVTNTVTSTPVYSGPIISGSEIIGGSSDFGIESVTQYRFEGQRLEGVSAVFIDGKPGEVISTAPDHIIITAPAGLDNGIYDLVIESPLGRLTYLDAITINETPPIESNSYGEVSAWTKRISDTQLKVYVKFPTVGEKVRISHQTGGAGPYESVYVRTTSSETMEGLRIVEGVGTYIVRTIDLASINRIRVTVGDEVLVQVRYNN